MSQMNNFCGVSVARSSDAAPECCASRDVREAHIPRDLLLFPEALRSTTSSQSEFSTGYSALSSTQQQHEPLLPVKHSVNTRAVENCITMVMVGPTGQGKSTLGNLLAGESLDVFASSDDFDSTTTQAAHVDFKFDGRAFRIIDTVGFLDTRMGAAECINSKFVEFADRAPRGVDCFLFVLSRGRFTEQSLGQVKTLAGIAGDDVLKHTALVFTRCGEDAGAAMYKRCMASENQFLKEAVSSVAEMVGVESFPTTGRDKQREAILRCVLRMCDRNSGQRYSNHVLSEAGRRREFLQRCISSLSPERRATMQAYLDDVYHGRLPLAELENLLQISSERDHLSAEQRKRDEELLNQMADQIRAAHAQANFWKKVAKDAVQYTVGDGPPAPVRLRAPVGAFADGRSPLGDGRFQALVASNLSFEEQLAMRSSGRSSLEAWREWTQCLGSCGWC
eukprot:gnl/MRDRNA2_/MRDRNA2_35614_c0_seq1.p1 gnl/MRDRNA2_/MRDRNA2_35614_c0~~gnl/MRDRNA2_/MRDRNA2_35614_c0_seq1.p1  ORF type:complete len:450 (-),score=87.93 gnl/MRDRNA2_/MRDRNA2_35614_c0_seq1:92-1441(-)